MDEIEIKNREAYIAFVGNPNSGKTSVFNAFTGLRQKVANYPGVTVEKKTGLLTRDNGMRMTVCDLPGLYSLIPKSLDDKITTDIISGRSQEVENLKLLVIVVDASNLSRNLYLVTQIIELGTPCCACLKYDGCCGSKGSRN